MAITAATIDRLKSQLLTSGLSQQNQALFQIINSLIDAARESLTGVANSTGGGSGSTGAVGPQGPQGLIGPPGLDADCYESDIIIPTGNILLPLPGNWQDVPFNAADFTANLGATWTVAAGDVQVLAYTEMQRTMFVSFRIFTTTVNALPTQLLIRIPNGRTSVRGSTIPYQAIVAGVASVGLATVNAGGTDIVLFQDFAATAWPNSVDGTYVIGSIYFDF